jgi:hypothetical protein
MAMMPDHKNYLVHLTSPTYHPSGITWAYSLVPHREIKSLRELTFGDDCAGVIIKSAFKRSR